jgi:hypothetical protein
MSLLAPLYALGALAVALPIVFHLLQRRPRQQVDFSSLMFLTPSAPRITRRSRLNHLWLLALRALALVLLAAAFTRPFWRSLQQITGEAPERRVAILIDRSASMQRTDVWPQVAREVETVLQGLGENDQAALFSFDDRLHVEVGFTAEPVTAAATVKAIRAAFKQVRPGWHATHVGRALLAAVEQLRTAEGSGPVAEANVVLISDLQQGANLEGLREFSWPSDVRVDVRQVAPRLLDNVTVRTLPADPASSDLSSTRVRVTNEAASKTDSFQLVWRNGQGEAIGVAKAVQVPPGRSRVINLTQPDGAQQLAIQGDSQPFDNVAFVAEPLARDVSVLFLGDAQDEPDRLYYFLQRAPLGVGSLHVALKPGDGADLAQPPNPMATPLVIVATPPKPEWVTPLHQYLENGGRVLVVIDPSEPAWALHGGQVPAVANGSDTDVAANVAAGDTERDAAADTAVQLAADQLAQLCRVDALQVARHADGDYAMLAEIDFRHPLFLPFADAKFSDFTKVRIWQSVVLTTSTDQEPPWTVVARFDDDRPALVERSIGSGRLWILATGWCPQTSQLALSTKFVPLLVTMLGPDVARAESEPPVHVGDRIDLTGRGPFRVALTPAGQTKVLPDSATEFPGTDEVGLYVFSGQQVSQSVAVNLPPQESRTVPLDPSELEQRGVPLGRAETAAETSLKNRQMKDVELESQQKLWRWLLVMALSVLALETYFAARASHQELAASTT